MKSFPASKGGQDLDVDTTKGECLCKYLFAHPQGTGLGLAIITDIVSKHHGTLNIDSEHGQFTKVTVRAPVID